MQQIDTLKISDSDTSVLIEINFLRYIFYSGLSLGRIGIGALLQKVLVLCYVHQVKLEPKFVSVMIAMGVVEGLGKRLDPDVDVLLRAAPHILRASLCV